MRLGNFEEAKHALRWYMELVGVPDIDKTAQDHQTDKNTAAGTDKAVDQIRKKLAAVRKVHYKQHQYETELDIVRVLLAGVQLYGRESKTGKMATVVADIALELLLHGDENPGLCKEEWIAEAYRMRGAAYGLCATQCMFLTSPYSPVSVRLRDWDICIYFKVMIPTGEPVTIAKPLGL